jgi:hypothetical protein
LNEKSMFFSAIIKDYTGSRVFLLKNASPEQVENYVIYLNSNVTIEINDQTS